MIEPIVAEEDWMRPLCALPSWGRGERPILFISPHPDDETLGAGGLIASLRAAGTEVSVVAVTDGEAAYPDQPHLATLRTEEQEAALKKLGVASEQISRLHYPDGNVAGFEDELVDAIAPMVSSSTLLLAPWVGDFHPDHEACGRAAVEVARRTGAPLSFYFFWTWHRGTAELLEPLPLRVFALSDAIVSLKRDALSCHRSQLARESGEPILPEDLLGPMKRNFEVFLDA